MLQIQFFLHSTSFFLHGTTFALGLYVVVPWRRKVVLFILEKGDIEGCLPLKVIFHQRSSSNQGRLPSKVSFHQGHLPLKVVFHRRSFPNKHKWSFCAGTTETSGLPALSKLHHYIIIVSFKHLLCLGQVSKGFLAPTNLVNVLLQGHSELFCSFSGSCIYRVRFILELKHFSIMTLVNL